MTTTRTAAEILEREFLIVRAKLLEAAAAFDRLDRAEGSVVNDPRRQKLRQALDVLAADEPDRAEKLQLLFSLPFDANWRAKFGLSENGQAAQS
jgi:site-specific recombinase